MEADTEEAFEKRRELVKLLVEKIVVGRAEDSEAGGAKAKVEITYRFGPPEASLEVDSANGVQDSEEFARARRGSGENLLSRHPEMTSYEVAVEREAPRSS